MTVLDETKDASNGDRPLPLTAGVLGVLLYVLIAVMAATIEVLLIPLRAGTVLLPITVLLGVATNIALPLLVQRLVAKALAAAMPIVAWFLTLAVLAGSRPEGDVIVPGGKYASLSYVYYALALTGVLAGVVTIVRTDSRRPHRVIRAAPVPAARPTPTRPAAKISSGRGRPARPSRRR